MILFSPSLEGLPLPEGSLGAGMGTGMRWNWQLRAAAQTPWKWSKGKNIGGVSLLSGPPVQYPWSFPSHLSPAPWGPWASCLCHNTCTRHRSSSLKFQLLLLSEPLLLHAGLCQAGAAPAQVGKGSSKEVLPLSLGAHCPHLPLSYLVVGKPHTQSTININTTNTISGSSCSFTHATSLSFLKMISVHLFCFTATCHQVASVCSFPFSSLLRSTPVFHLKLTKEFSFESCTSHILELCLLHSLDIYFWNGLHAERPW